MSLPANYRQMAMLSTGPILPNTPPTSSSTSSPSPSSTSSTLPSSSSTGGGGGAGTTSSSGSSSTTTTAGTSASSTPTTKSKERMARPGGTPGSSMGGSKGGVGGDASVPSPFSTPAHGNPAFAPQKMGGGSGSKSSASSNDSRSLPKPPKGPDKPLMPYMRYSRKVWDQVKAANQDLKLWEIGKIIGSMWRDLPEADKQDFVDEYEAEKVEYQKNLEVYHQSSVYQQYLVAKSKVAVAAAAVKDDSDSTPVSVSASTASSGGGGGSSSVVAAPVHQATKLDRRIDIQPAEDEEDYDDSVTLKHISHARYVRNHRLINEVFSDTMVPDVRSVVTAQRLTVLRRQVQSLTMHQKKLETELLQIEDKFDAKKRKFVEAGDAFQSELKKVKSNAPKLDDAYFASLVERERETLKREAEERQRQQQQQAGGGGANATSPASSTAPPPEPSTGPAASNNATPVENNTCFVDKWSGSS